MTSKLGSRLLAMVPCEWTLCLAATVSLFLLMSVASASNTSPIENSDKESQAAVVEFPDANLLAAIRSEIDKPSGPIYATDLVDNDFTSLMATNRGITDLSGLEYCSDLEILYLSGNQISDLSPLRDLTNLNELFLGQGGGPNPVGNHIESLESLSSLTQLVSLSIDGNQISSLSPIAGLVQLEYLHLAANDVSDISVLGNMVALRNLDLWGNPISDPSVLSGLTNLTNLGLDDCGTVENLDFLQPLTSLAWLHLWNNRISNIDVLRDLPNLRGVFLGGNNIGDIRPLVDNSGLSIGDTIGLQQNPLSVRAVDQDIQNLVDRGITVQYDGYSVPPPETQPIYPNLPGPPSEDQDKIILITHGWTYTSIAPDIEWTRELEDRIDAYLYHQTNGKDDWRVVTYDWMDHSQFPAQTDGPALALSNAVMHGYALGATLADAEYSTVHFIAHSAGSALIEAASTKLGSAQVHTTFLDPFYPPAWEDIQQYGLYSTYSENYFAVDWTPWTQQALSYCYNVNVTNLDPAYPLEMIVVGESTHSWPHEFYSETALMEVHGSLKPYPYALGHGFPLSIEGEGGIGSKGRGNVPTVLYKQEQPVLKKSPLRSPSYNAQRAELVRIDPIVDPSICQQTTGGTGSMGFDSIQVDLETSSTFWALFDVEMENTTNLLRFEVRFDNEPSSESVVSITFGGLDLGSLDERYMASEWQKTLFYFPYNLKPGIHVLGIRVDSYGTVDSQIAIRNIATGYEAERADVSSTEIWRLYP